MKNERQILFSKETQTLIKKRPKEIKKKVVTVAKLLLSLQKVFNDYIRARDKKNGYGCISCLSPKIEHASHYFSQGHYKAMRFDERNVHGSCKKCNTFLHGNLIEYRKGLVKRYGNDYVNKLENDPKVYAVSKLSRFEILELIEKYKQKIKEL